MNAHATPHRIPSKRSWLHALSGRFTPPAQDSALVSTVISRGRRTLHGVVVLTPLPRLWDEDEEDDDDDTLCDDPRGPVQASDLG